MRFCHKEKYVGGRGRGRGASQFAPGLYDVEQLGHVTIFRFLFFSFSFEILVLRLVRKNSPRCVVNIHSGPESPETRTLRILHPERVPIQRAKNRLKKYLKNHLKFPILGRLQTLGTCSWDMSQNQIGTSNVFQVVFLTYWIGPQQCWLLDPLHFALSAAYLHFGAFIWPQTRYAMALAGRQAGIQIQARFCSRLKFGGKYLQCLEYLEISF